jgi:hypothetical protein
MKISIRTLDEQQEGSKVSPALPDTIEGQGRCTD